MSIAERWHACTRIPAVRTTLMSIGFVLMILSPLAGILPGPGGLLVFAAGLALVLRYSEWAKRKYVRLKRRHPKTGAWTDWGMRRPSAARRRERDKALAEAAKAEQIVVEQIVVERTVVVERMRVQLERDRVGESDAMAAVPLRRPAPGAPAAADEDEADDSAQTGNRARSG